MDKMSADRRTMRWMRFKRSGGLRNRCAAAVHHQVLPLHRFSGFETAKRVRRFCSCLINSSTSWPPASGNPLFLALGLAVYQERHDLDDVALAAVLGCSLDVLTGIVALPTAWGGGARTNCRIGRGGDRREIRSGCCGPAACRRGFAGRGWLPLLPPQNTFSSPHSEARKSVEAVRSTGYS